MLKLRILISFFLFCILDGYKIECKVLSSASARPANSKVCSTAECKNAASIILENIDPKVAPCDDFYQFSCGNFLKKTVVPEDMTLLERTDLINQKVMQQLIRNIEEPIQSSEPRSIRLAKNLYKACTNTAAIEKNGIKTILEKLKEIGGWPVLEGNLWNEKKYDWKQSTYDMRKLGFGTNYFFNFELTTTEANPSSMMLNINQAFTGLDGVYIEKGFSDPIVKSYFNFMVDTAVSFGAKKAIAGRELKESLEFEMKLANIWTSAEATTNAPTPYANMTVKDLTRTYPSIPWKKYINSILRSIEIRDSDVISVIVPSFLKKFEILMKETPKRVLANYQLWRAVQESLHLLPDKLRNRQLTFETNDFGIGESGNPNEPRWKTCIEVTSNMLGASLGSLYVRKHFNPESKKSAEKLTADIEEQFKKILKEVDWMDEKTKATVLGKLKSMQNFIGYPDELLSDKTLDEYYKNLDITPDDYFQAVLNTSVFTFDKSFSEFRMPKNVKSWRYHSESSKPFISYVASTNNLDVAAGILQDVFFNKDRPQYLNYAAIGSDIASEIANGFGNEDGPDASTGSLTLESRKKFEKKARCIVEQYENYTVKGAGFKLNGSNTRDENIADNAGVKISYLAYQDWVKQNKPEPKLPGLNYSQSQLFWIQAAIKQCGKYTPEYLKDDIQNDSSSPPEFRVIGSFSNRPEFAKDFNCPSGSKMNPAKKCSVW